MIGPRTRAETEALGVLRILAAADGRWATHWGDVTVMPSVAPAFTEDRGVRARLARMAALVRKGYASGCYCGCRGDFVITAKGRERLAALEAL